MNSNKPLKTRKGRLKRIKEIQVKVYEYKVLIQKLEEEIKEIINLDEDFKSYEKRCSFVEYMTKLNYEDYCKFYELFSQSSPEDDYYKSLQALLKITDFNENSIRVIKGGKEKSIK